MVQAAEARTGARPWRRTDLLRQRVEQHQSWVERAEAKQCRAVSRLSDCQERLGQVEQERQIWAQQVRDLEMTYRTHNRPERPHSRLAQARRKLEVRERRLVRRRQDLEKAQTWLSRCQQKAAALQTEHTYLQERLDRFLEDNRTNPWPIRAIFRLDGGFGTSLNVALLIEMGYEVYSKASNYQTTRALRRRAGSGPWLQVGKNAEMIAWDNTELSHCPYPLDLALERFHTGETLKHAVLLHYGPQPVTTDLEGWFHFYNGRQTIEAGIKEGKNVFQMHHLKVRSPAGLVIQEEFAVFAANFVRWAAAWLCQICPEAPAPFNQTRPNVKQLVRVAANTSAWVIWEPEGCLLRFTELSALAGVELKVRDVNPFQLALPLFKSCVFSPI
jgi:hypothetical protein